MAEPTDAIVPILQRIQTDVAETKRELARKFAELEQRVQSRLVARRDQEKVRLRDRVEVVRDQPLQVVLAEVAGFEARVQEDDADRALPRVLGDQRGGVHGHGQSLARRRYRPQNRLREYILDKRRIGGHTSAT